MKKLITTFVTYPFYANIIIIFLFGGGLFSYMSMRKSFFPETKPRNITVKVFYPGASPKEMDEGVTTRIEEAIRSIVGIKETVSTSSENFAIVNIETTGVYDLDETLAEVKNAVDGISSFPSAAERPTVFKQRSVTMAMNLSLSGDESLEGLKNYAYKVEDDFYASGKISQIQVTGFPEIEISVEITEENLLRHKLSFDEIQVAIAANNVDISGGMIKSGDEEILIRSRARSVDPESIAEIIIRANPDGSYLRIRDVAEVKRKFADVSTFSKKNGKPAIRIVVSKLPEEDLEEIVVYVKDYIEKFNKTNENVKIDVDFDFLKTLLSRLDLLLHNGGSGLLLVLVTLALFLNLRLSFWVSWGIPSAFFAMFMVAVMYGITINMISLFGMILVVGILVDDGIVIAENIFTHFESGKSPQRAAIDGTIEVVPSVITSVLTTIVAFTPLLLIKNGGMEFLFEMAFVVIFSLGFSLLEAFFVLPAHLGNSHVLRQSKQGSIGAKLRNGLNVGVGFMREQIYLRVLRFSVKYRWFMFFVPVSLILLTVGLFGGGFIKATFFPAMSFDYFNVDFAFKPGSGEDKTIEYLEKFDKIVWSVNEELKKENNDTVDYITYTYENLGTAFNGLETGSHAGGVFVGLRDLDDAKVTSYDIRLRIQKEIGVQPELERLSVASVNTRWGAPISITLLSSNTEMLHDAKVFLKEKLNTVSKITNIQDNNAEGKQEILIQLKPQAYFMGLNQVSISNQVRQGFYGGQAQRLQSGKDELRVWVRFPKSDRMTIGLFEKMKIKTIAGEFPLSELIDYKIERGPVNIKRYNGMREITVEADVINPKDPVPAILADIKEKIIPKLLEKYPEVKIDYRGQEKRSKETGAEMGKYFIGAFLVITLILMIHFRSAWHAIIVLMMIPLGWLGALWGHGIESNIVSMLSAWGMVALSGVIINDAVVFLSRYNDLLLLGYKVKDAVIEAGKSRFRPIILTTLTTSFGLYPLILETSFQAQFLIPMAISLAYGVFIGTGFLLTFFPVLILCLNDLKVLVKYLKTGEKPTNEEVEVAIIHRKREQEIL